MTLRLSWPAKAGHPGDVFTKPAKFAMLHNLVESALYAQLGGPLLRAMTILV
jgi:hypothetical protein